MSLWKIIAKKEIRLKTFRVRRNRRLFFILIYTVLIVWAAFIGPIIFDEILPEVLKNFSVQFEPLISLILEYSFMMLFVMYTIYPLFLLYRKTEIGIKDTIIASPIKPGDIFTGEFIGQLPFYFLFLLGIGPLGTSLLRQINPEMGFYHFISFYAVTFTLSMFALLVGTILSNWIENRIYKSKKVRELHNWVFVILSFIVISIFYIFHFLFELISNFPDLKVWMLIFPSYWYSNITLYLINPTLVSSYILNIWLNVGLAIVIPLLLFYISYKRANLFYNLERTIEKKSKIIREESKFYNFIAKITPNKWKGLVIIHFKEFLRKRENYAKLIYSTIFIGFIGFFLAISLNQSTIILEDNPLGISLILEILQHKFLLVLIIAWIGALIFSVLIGISILIRSKELLFIYKKSPRGIISLIFSYLFVMFIIILFLDISLSIFFAFLFQIDIILILIFFFIFMLYSGEILIEALAIQCFKPLFEERGKDVFFNMYLILIVQIFSLLITLFIVMPFLSPATVASIGIIYILLSNLGVSGIIAYFMIYLGIKKLNQIE
ncbi:MAG: hypothetical protein ACFE9S_15225 [Candidatus Hermodarchaeota archaeon]